MKTAKSIKKISIRLAGDVRLTSACGTYQAGTSVI